MTLNLQAYDPKQDAAPSHGGQPLTSSLRSSIRQLRDLLKEQKDITLDGESLDLGSTVAVARYVSPTLLWATLTLQVWLQCIYLEQWLRRSAHEHERRSVGSEVTEQ